LNEIRTKPFRLTARHRPVINKVTHFSGKENERLVLQLERRNRGLRAQFVTCWEHRDEGLAQNRFDRQPLSRPAIAQKSKIQGSIQKRWKLLRCHKFAKLSRGPDTFAAILQGMGRPAPHLVAWLTTLTELLGGLAVLLGAFVTIICVTMTAVLLVAMFKVHLPYGFSSIKLLAVTATSAKFGPVGYEIILLYIACLAALVIGGSGPFAIDGRVRKRSEARTSTNRAPKLFCRI
jgi:putative oxidoreductase